MSVSAVINITILPPLSTPTLTLTRVPGNGTWTAGNYTIGIFSDASGGGVYGNSHASHAARNSNYTFATIELFAGDAVLLNWSSIDLSTSSIFIFHITSTTLYDYTGIPTGCTTYTYSFGCNIALARNGTMLSTNSFAQRTGGLYTYQPTNFYFGLRPDKGIGQIRVNATENFYPKDIMNAIRSSSMVRNEDYIEMGTTGVITVYSLDLSDTKSNVNFILDNSLIYFYGGIYSAIGNATIYSSKDTRGTTILGSKRGGYGHAFNIGNISTENIAINSLQLYYRNSSPFYGMNGNRFYGEPNNIAYSFTSGIFRSGFLRGGYGGFDSVFVDSLITTGTINANVFNDLPTRGIIRANTLQTYPNPGMTIANYTLFLDGTYQIFQTCSGNKSNYLLDNVFNIFYNNTGIVSIPTFYIFNYVAGTYGVNSVFIGNTVSLNITNGTSLINNASVLLYDKNNSLIFNVSTINGSISRPVFFFNSTSRDVGASFNGIANINNSIQTNYNPYKLIISKSGYYDYILENFTIDKKIDWTIVLEPIAWCPATFGEIYFTPDGSGEILII